jgi:hypothetical protein
MYADTPRNPVAQVNREIPKEVLFRLSHDDSNMPRQDPIKNNRYRFKYPEEWSNRQLKDKVLGIRNMYLLERWFTVEFNFIIQCRTITIPSQTETILEEPFTEETFTEETILGETIPSEFVFLIRDCYIERGQTLNDFCDYFNGLINRYIERSGIITEAHSVSTTTSIEKNTVTSSIVITRLII